MVLFPTPPFWLAIAMIRATPGVSGTTGIFLGLGLRGQRHEPVAAVAEPPLAEERDGEELGVALAPEALVTAGS